jgi:NADH:ubiquinone oxidoreductase subunit 3 (subunit A)
MNWILLTPPLAFLILLLVAALELWSFRALTARGKESKGKTKPYACGEDIDHHRLQPDYYQFFSVAFCFTILHVAAMIIATVPSGSLEISVLAVLFALSAGVGLAIFMRKEERDEDNR